MSQPAPKKRAEEKTRPLKKSSRKETLKIRGDDGNGHGDAGRRNGDGHQINGKAHLIQADAFPAQHAGEDDPVQRTDDFHHDAGHGEDEGAFEEFLFFVAACCSCLAHGYRLSRKFTL